MRTSHRRTSAFCALVLSVVLALGGTFAWSSVGQQAKNEAMQGPKTAPVELQKLETGTDAPLAGAGFLLYRADGTQVGGLSTTDAEGQITLSLPAGDYWFEEFAPAPGHGFALDEDGNAVTKYPFTVSEENTEGGLPVTVTVHDPQLAGTLTVLKTVENADGAPLSGWQRKQNFTFTVTFSDGIAYPYDLLDESWTVVESDEALTAEGTLTLKHGQMAVFSDVPAGVTYTVTEQAEPGYILRSAGHTGQIARDGALAQFRNIYQNGGLEIAKTVVNEDGAEPDGTAFPFVVSFSDGGTFEYDILDEDGNVVESSKSLSSGGTLALTHGQTARFSYLPAGVTYTVTEQPAEGYRPARTTCTGEIVVGLTARADFENRHGEEPNAPGSLAITKRVQAPDGSGPTAAQKNQEFTFTVTFSDDAAHAYSVLDESGTVVDGGSLASGGTLTLKHGQTAVFDDLPRGTTYSVAERYAEGYRALTQSTGGTVWGGAAAEAAFRNIPTAATGRLVLSKTLEGAYPEEDEDKAFDFSVTFSDGGTYGYSIVASDGTAISTGTLSSGGTLALQNGQSAQFPDLPAGVTYTVTEAKYAGYRPSIVNGYGTVEGGAFILAAATNTWPDIRISGVKTWDLGGKDAALPRSVWVRLYQGDALIERLQVEPDSGGNWAYSFTVPEYDAEGNALVYRVEEEPVADYTAEYVSGTYDIINHYTPSSGPVSTPRPGSDDDDDDDDDRPRPTPTPTSSSAPTSAPSSTPTPGAEPTPTAPPTLTPTSEPTPDQTAAPEPSPEPSPGPVPPPTPGPGDTPGDAPGDTPAPSDVPKTDDGRRPGLWLALGLMSLLGLAVCARYADTRRYHGKRVMR